MIGARKWLVLVVALAFVAMTAAHTWAQDGDSRIVAEIDLATMKDRAAVLRVLNSDKRIVDGRDEAQSYKLLFDAYLRLSQPPMPIGPDFNLEVIHPSMNRWSEVATWAESNQAMAEAIVEAGRRKMFGLPYGADNVSPEYRQADLVAVVADDGDLNKVDMLYQSSVDTMMAFVTAEAYRRLEAGDIEAGLELAVASLFIMRQICDRQFVEEKIWSMEVLIAALTNLRCMMYRYLDQIDVRFFIGLAWNELPDLRPTHRELPMPEADKLLYAALIWSAFDRIGTPDSDKFGQVFGKIQAAGEPMVRFGAAQRWRMVAAVHASREASLQKLKDVYDDWWQRWRLNPFDKRMFIQPELLQINPVRYSAVVHAVDDIEALFIVRDRLIAAVNGTAISAGLCAYYREFGTYPDQTEKVYTRHARRRSDLDPWEAAFDRFKYQRASARRRIQSPWGDIWVPAGGGILYSRGQDGQDDRAATHTTDAAEGSDYVIWPPIREAARAAGHPVN